jgi:hypothetical protein
MHAASSDSRHVEHLYDCKHGQDGWFYDETEEDPTKALMGFVRVGTFGSLYYQAVCRAVMHEEPYMSN